MEQTKNQKVAFIGTGIMGAPIAKHILDAGWDLTVYNRSAKKTEALAEAGAHVASSVAEAVRDADVVFTMLGYPTDVEGVYLSADGILKNAKPKAWLIDLTTSSPLLAKELHEAAAQQGMHCFDCPVTGGQAGAEAGTLTLIAGISEEEVQPVLPLLECFSSKIFYFGEASKGQAAKLCNQVSLASCMVGMADALALAEQTGLDQEKVVEMVSSGMGASRAMTDLAQKAIDGDYKPGFINEHMRKDIALAIQNSEDLDITLPGAETAFTLYDMLCQIGGSRLGTQALAVLYQDEAAAVAAGLDWSLLNEDALGFDGCCEDDECGCGDDHHHDECCGHEHHHHGNDCCCGHDHAADDLG